MMLTCGGGDIGAGKGGKPFGPILDTHPGVKKGKKGGKKGKGAAPQLDDAQVAALFDAADAPLDATFGALGATAQLHQKLGVPLGCLSADLIFNAPSEAQST